MHIPGDFSIWACDTELLHLLKLMNTENAQCISSMRAHFLAEAGRIACIPETARHAQIAKISRPSIHAYTMTIISVDVFTKLLILFTNTIYHINDLSHAILNNTKSAWRHHLIGSFDGCIQSPRWRAHNGCSEVAIKYLSSPSPDTFGEVPMQYKII